MNSLHSDPFLNSAKVSDLFSVLKPNEGRSWESKHAEAFCFALRLMAEGSASGPRSRLAREEIMMRKNLKQETPQRYLKTPLYWPTQFAIRKPAALMRKRIQVLVVVGVFSVQLRRALNHGRIGRIPDNLGDVHALFVPTSTSIPFHSMMDIPLPFSSDAATKFASCHVANMTAGDFLADGEWAGFYSMSLDSGNVNFGPMLYIRFSATTHSEGSTILDLHGTGMDAQGHFDLGGKIATDTGQISLRKTYIHDSAICHWACFMTPMGIVGSWGDEHCGSWIWLWKTGWAAGQ